MKLINNLTALIVLNPWKAIWIAVGIGALLMLFTLALLVRNPISIWIVTSENFAHVLLLAIVAFLVGGFLKILTIIWPSIEAVNLPPLLIWGVAICFVVLLGYVLYKIINHWRNSVR
jgi:hypothetical protein